MRIRRDASERAGKVTNEDGYSLVHSTLDKRNNPWSELRNLVEDHCLVKIIVGLVGYTSSCIIPMVRKVTFTLLGSLVAALCFSSIAFGAGGWSKPKPADPPFF